MAAGELSELFGEVALTSDRDKRLHRFRSRATDALEILPASYKKLLGRYVDGVNAGLGDLGSKPFEYWLLGADPVSWTAEDTYLVVYSMFFTLQQSDGAYEWNRHLLKQSLPSELAEFLLPVNTPWDAPLQGMDAAYVTPKIPSASMLNWNENQNMATNMQRDDTPMLGSSNWAVAGDITASGAAMVSNDMHLSIRAPSIWYKLRMKLTDGSLNISGVSLPGVPAIVVGSNGSLAWGFTNTNIDSTDIIELEINPNSKDQYMTKDGYKDFDVIVETINVKDGSEKEITVR
jgi:penicillin amidase